MNTDFFAVQSSVIAPQALLNVLNDRYNIKFHTCRLWSGGINDVYNLQSETGTLYLRISHSIRFTKEDFNEEVYIINTLHEHGIPACVPIADKNCEYIWEISAPEGQRYAVLFSEAKQVNSEDNINKLYNLGVMSAKLHLVSDTQNFTVSREPLMYHQLVTHSLENLREPLVNRKEDFEFLRTSAESLWEFISDRLVQESPYYGYCHGDIHSGNVFFNGEDPQIFDFDCMGYGYRAYDICIYAWNETFSNDNYIETDEWKKYLKGYSSVRNLSENELACIPAFSALRHLWLMGLHIDATATTFDWSTLNDGYYDYHISRYKLWYNRIFTSK